MEPSPKGGTFVLDFTDAVAVNSLSLRLHVALGHCDVDELRR